MSQVRENRIFCVFNHTFDNMQRLRGLPLFILVVVVEVEVVVGGSVPPVVHQLHVCGHTYLIPGQYEHPLLATPALPPGPQKKSYFQGAPAQFAVSSTHIPEVGSGEPLQHVQVPPIRRYDIC